VGELGELRIKVDEAVNRLSEAHESRRRQSQGLMTLLSDLEAKFEARGEEVRHCQRRIEALTRENADLSNLVEQLVKIVDNTVKTDDEDALFRASATAAELVADWSGPADRREEATGVETEDQAPQSAGTGSNLDDLIAAKLGYDSATAAFANVGPGQGFQDVGQEELDSEELRSIPDELPGLLEEAASFDVEEELSVEDIDEPFEVIGHEDDETPAESVAAELDVDGIDMPDIDMNDLEVVELETEAFDVSDTFDPVREQLAADLDIPEIKLEDEEPISRLDPDEDTETSIRAMMARLEQAAARAKANTDAAAEADPETVSDDAPAFAVGGTS
jgi:hypothetical protein